MFIVEVVPLTKIPPALPQVFSYFSAKNLLPGVLVFVMIGRRQENAIVIETHELKKHKIDIKSADYEMKPIKKILCQEPVLTENQIKLALWLGQYYFASPGLFLKMMIRKTASNIPISKYHNIQKLIIAPTLTHVDLISKKYPIAVIVHSGLRQKQFSENWQKIASGKAKIIIGTRLAAFAPFTNLKEIIIENETNSGHSSWDMFPHYRAHEIVMKLAELFEAKPTLKSGLPSVESRFISPIQPISPLNPKPEIIDLRQELREGNFSIFSRTLQKAINEAINKKQQIILFINRRGLGTFVLCRDCGYVAKCQNCEAPLAYHTIKTNEGLKPILICHHCGNKQDPLHACPKCQSPRIKAFGAGTEKVEAEAEKLFKNASILRLDSDTAPTPKDQQKIIEKFKQKKADILIGTQMILNANPGRVALVAMISADTLMHLPDFHSDEQLFQTIFSLSRLISHSERNEESPTYVGPHMREILRYAQDDVQNSFLIQTYNPQNKTLQLAAEGNFEKFYEQEIETRKILKYPPFSQLIKLTFRHKDPKRAGQEAKILHAKLTQQLKTSIILNDAILEISDPVPAFIPKQKGKYVWQIILKVKPYWLTPTAGRADLLKTRNKFLSFAPAGWEIDIDPETLL